MDSAAMLPVVLDDRLAGSISLLARFLDLGIKLKPVTIDEGLCLRRLHAEINGDRSRELFN